MATIKVSNNSNNTLHFPNIDSFVPYSNKEVDLLKVIELKELYPESFIQSKNAVFLEIDNAEFNKKISIYKDELFNELESLGIPKVKAKVKIKENCRLKLSYADKYKLSLFYEWLELKEMEYLSKINAMQSTTANPTTNIVTLGLSIFASVVAYLVYYLFKTHFGIQL